MGLTIQQLRGIIKEELARHVARRKQLREDMMSSASASREQVSRQQLQQALDVLVLLAQQAGDMESGKKDELMKHINAFAQAYKSTAHFKGAEDQDLETPGVETHKTKKFDPSKHTRGPGVTPQRQYGSGRRDEGVRRGK